MQNPTTRHSYVQINNSFVHLLQYGPGENLIRSSSNLSTNSSSFSLSSNGYNTAINKTANNSFGNSYGTTNTDNNTTLTACEFPSRRLIIFIPGNPGVLGVYHDFLVSLSRMLSSSLSSANKDIYNQPTILAIGHNNFDHPDHVDYKAEERICIEEGDLNFVERAVAKNYHGEPHHIEFQVLNKLIILKRLLNVSIEDCKLIFIGHSIGCYIILRLLQDRLIASAHEGSIMIHPALENVALTDKGSSLVKFFNYKLDLVTRSVAFVLDKCLPKTAKLALVKWFCSVDFVQNSSEMAIDSVAQLACQKTLNALIQMAKSEFALVKNINTDSMIKPHVPKLKLIYAINDHWVNTENRRLLRELYPDLYMEEQATQHAFIMDPQTVMDYAFKVGMFVQDFIEQADSG